MKKTIILITTAILILSFTACGSPAVQEDAAQTTATIEPAEAPTPAPTPTQQPTPTPEPTPTPVVLTDEEQEYLELFEYLPKKDFYAALILSYAYNKKELDHLIDIGEVSHANITELISITDDWDFYSLRSDEFVEKIQRGETGENNVENVIIVISNGIENIVPLNDDAVLFFSQGIDLLFERGFTFESAFSKTDRDDLQELLDLFFNIADEGNMDKFHERYQREELSPFVAYYFLSYINRHPDFIDETGTFKEEYTPLVTYRGEEIYFMQYFHAYCLYEKTEIDMEKYLYEVHVDGLPVEEYEKTKLEDYDWLPAIEATR